MGGTAGVGRGEEGGGVSRRKRRGDVVARTGGDRGQKWNVGLGMRLTDASAPVSAGAVGCWGGGKRKEQSWRGRGPVAMAAGTAGAQSAGTWSSGHGRGLTEGEKGGDEEALPLPSGLYQEESFQRVAVRCWEWSTALGPAQPYGGCQGGNLLQVACAILGSHWCLTLAPGDPSSLSPLV